jgi:ribosomal protein L32
MCLECGYYNGRQVMDLEALKAKRDARMSAKREQIKMSSGTSDSGTTATPETAAAGTK